MIVQEGKETYPRTLRIKEREALDYVLPSERPGYREYANAIERMVVLGAGRRGEGNLVLGFEGDTPDTVSPLPPVVGYGVIESTADHYSITVREMAGRQIDIEIVSRHQQTIPDHFEERRRWTYSRWSPGDVCPSTGSALREIRIDVGVVLALCVEDKRIWVYEQSSGMVHLIPVTNFYQELMIVMKIQDPAIALHSRRLFSDSSRYTDDNFREAFIAYNRPRHRVRLSDRPPDVQRSGLGGVIQRLLRKGK